MCHHKLRDGLADMNCSMRYLQAPLADGRETNEMADSWFGKDHNTPFYQATQAGPVDQWPNGMGFEYFYGLAGGDTSQW